MGTITVLDTNALNHSQAAGSNSGSGSFRKINKSSDNDAFDENLLCQNDPRQRIFIPSGLLMTRETNEHTHDKSRDWNRRR